MDIHRTFNEIAKFLLVCALAANALWGQTGNGVVQGTVLDASKAVVPGAKKPVRSTMAMAATPENAVSTVRIA